MPCAVSPGADISLDEDSRKSEYYKWTSDTIWPEMGGICFRSGWTGYRMFASASPCFAVSTALQRGTQAITGSAGRASGSCESILAPGFRAYYATVGTELLLLLGGGSKRTQQTDIENAIARWKDYRSRR